jgi:hypothetical protein
MSAAPAGAATWWASGVIVNELGSTADTCPGAVNGLPAGCINVTTSSVTTGNWVVPPGPTAAIGGSNTSAFQFIAPESGSGADGLMSLTAPDGSTWNVAQYDDTAYSSNGTQNTSSGCAITSPVTLAAPPQYRCGPVWSMGTSMIVPDPVSVTAGSSIWVPFYFTRAGFTAPPDGVMGAGGICNGEMASGDTTDCSDQLGQIDPVNYRYYKLVNLGTNALQVGQPDLLGIVCDLPTQGSSCVWTTRPDSGDFVMSPGDGAPSGAASYDIAVMSVTAVPALIGAQWSPGTPCTSECRDAEAYMDPSDDDGRRRSVTTSLRTVARPPRATPDLVYRAPRAAGTSVFTLARRVGARWRPVAGPGRARAARAGDFSHRDHAGTNTVPVPARAGGEPLLPGRYRVTARATRGADTVGAGTATFRVRAEASR